MNDEAFDNLIRKSVQEQEGVHPSGLPGSEALWIMLAEKQRRNKANHRRQVWYAAAAALFVLVIGYVFLIPEKQTIDSVASITWSAHEQSAVDFIARYCEGENATCNAEVIQQLRNDLHASFEKLKEIDQQLKVYGDDAELVRARARIESHQARIIKTIVKTL